MTGRLGPFELSSAVLATSVFNVTGERGFVGANGGGMVHAWGWEAERAKYLPCCAAALPAREPRPYVHAVAGLSLLFGFSAAMETFCGCGYCCCC
jgi:hypothetical protein